MMLRHKIFVTAAKHFDSLRQIEHFQFIQKDYATLIGWAPGDPTHNRSISFAHTYVFSSRISAMKADTKDLTHIFQLHRKNEYKRKISKWQNTF